MLPSAGKIFLLRPRMKKLFRKFAIYSVTLLAGCRSVGPSAIRREHANFNEAIAQTLDEQLLTNLVRMRYLETFLFLDVGTVTDSRNCTLKAGLENNTKIYCQPHHLTLDLDPVLGGALSQTATVTYTPMQGINFVKRLFAPVPLPVVLNAIQSGWSANRVFRIFVERINYLHNAPTASGPTPILSPEYEQFAEMTQIMAALLRDDVLTMGIAPDGYNRLVIRILDDGKHGQEILAFKDILSLPRDGSTFTFQENLLSNTDGELRLRLRSVYSAMFYLANGVQVPEEHIAAGIVVATRNPSGDLFDWQSMLHDIITVHCSKDK
ncbi:MAG: hypothetical protein LBC42_02630, partial [Puniceicoccales bacterium]|nr:hypothetical protein [Puniceicoccales bacterium]